MKIFVLLLIFFMSNIAIGASFDCNKSTKKIEFSICKNASLSDADTELGNVYHSLRKVLSDEESIMLRNEQRAWIKQRSAICPSASVDCLMNEITLRTQELRRKLDIKEHSSSNISAYTPSYAHQECNSDPVLTCSPKNVDLEAFAICAVAIGGCEVAINKVDDSIKKHITEQACNAMTAKLSGQEYDINSMISTLGESAVEGAVKWFYGEWAGKIVKALNKTISLSSCINGIKNKCSTLHEQRQRKCQSS